METFSSAWFMALGAIILIDLVLAGDNAIVIALAARRRSVPIMVWGSTAVLRLIDRFPVIVYAGAGVLAFTAAKMIVAEPLLDHLFDPHWPVRWATYAGLVAAVLLAGHWVARRSEPIAAPPSAVQ